MLKPICADGVRSLCAKFSPSIETIAPDEVPMFEIEKDTTGESYVNTFNVVPTSDEIVRDTEWLSPVPVLALSPVLAPHMTSELVTQLEVPQIVTPSLALTEYVLEPKLKPISVMLAPAEAALFVPLVDKTGVS
jgi:hypothetical protein